MPDVNNEDEQLMVVDDVEDAITADSIGIPAFQLSFQRLTLKRIPPQIVQRMSHALIQRGFPLCDASNDAVCLIGELNPIRDQEKF